MSTDDEMATTYREDDRAREAMDALRREIQKYLTGDEDNLDRCSWKTREALVTAAQGLRKDSEHIVAVWD